MYSAYAKRIIRIEIPNPEATPEEILELIKKKTFKEEIISDTFLVEDESKIPPIVILKEKVKYDGIGKSFIFSGE